MILNCWSETREKVINFPRLDLDQRHSFQVAVRNLYFELSDLDFDSTDFDIRTPEEWIHEGRHSKRGVQVLS